MKRRKQKGQTTIEYLLILAVSVSLGITFMKRMTEYFLENPNSFVSRSLNNYKVILGDPARGYKTFRVVK